MSDAEEIPDGSELRKVKSKKNKKQKRKHADEDTTEGGDVAARVEAQTNECDNKNGSAVELVAENGKSSGEDREEVEAEGRVAKKRKVQAGSGIMSSEPFSNLKVSELRMKAIEQMGFVNMTQKHKKVKAKKYRQLYEKMALVVGNSIVMGRETQNDKNMSNDVQHEEENSRLDMLEDVDLGRDTPSPFFTENELTPDQSPSVNPSTSSRRRKIPQMATDDSIRYVDIMKEIAVVLRESVISRHVKKDWYEALTEIPDLSIEMKFRAPLLLDTPMKEEMFTKLPVEERLSWLKYCAGEM